MRKTLFYFAAFVGNKIKNRLALFVFFLWMIDPPIDRIPDYPQDKQNAESMLG